MHITVFCPHCQSRYQLDPSLRGKRMRCLNTICRMVFEVREEPEASRVLPPKQEEPAAQAAGTRGVKPVVTGAVGEIVPVLPCEAARCESSPAEAPSTDDVDIPGDDESPAPSRPAWNEEHPIDVAPGTWEAPPVRVQGKIDSARVTISAGPPIGLPGDPAGAETGKETGRRGDRRRRSIAIILTMLVILGGALGGGVYLVSGTRAAGETEQLARAQELYQNQDFEEAVAAFQKLLREFPTSKNRRQYDFLVELSAVREAVYTPREQTEERGGALERVLQFLEIYTNDPFLKEYHGDVWHTLQRLARELTSLAEQKQDEDILNRAKRSWAEAGKFTPPSGANVDEAAQALNAEFTRVANLLAARSARLELLAELREMVARGSAAAVRAGRALAKNAGMERDPEVAPLLEELVHAHRARVVFTPAAQYDTGGLAPRRSPDSAQDLLPSFYIAPQVGKVYQNARSAPAYKLDVVLALARGVLYALDAARGEVLWVRRVGVDTSVLPLRAPPSLFGPELVLVLSSDSKSVLAVVADTGAVVWQHTLGGVCLGQPVLVDRHLLVPTLSGQVEEIETTGGVLQGSYTLDQPLVVGGVHQPGTPLVYFPADSYCVYVLDVAKRACAAVLYTGHAPGSLRGLPLIWNQAQPGIKGEKRGLSDEDTPLAPRGSPGAGGGWLLLSLASGAGSVEMRPFALPIRQPDQKPAGPKITVRGDSWAPPWHDGEKLALVTDAELLALYGIRQKGDRDPLLFPLLQDDYRLDFQGRVSGRGRVLVVHADTENYWVVSSGKLQRLEATFTAQAGPGLVGRWPRPIDVGSPLHAAQVHVRADGLATLILVTQELDNPTCWVRAVEAEHGQVLWQRQLGLVCQDQPVGAGAGVLVSDTRGVFLFQTAPASHMKSWQPGGTSLEEAGQETGHWTWAREAGFVHLSWSKSVLGVHLIDSKGRTAARKHPLPAPPLGTPALGSDFILLPLANGTVLRAPLDEGEATSGPEWRGVGVEEFQAGHIVALGNNDFAITDGGRSLLRLHWGEAKAWEKSGETEMARRITTAPAVLGNRLLVADDSGTVTLLEGERLTAGRRWSMGAKITAGPFTRAGGVGLVVGKNRLVWLDPGKDEPVWEYACVAPIVGQPELAEDLLVVADLQGGIMAIDPTTGNPVGSGYRLKANEAPAAAPLAFGTGQVFVPLMDGTALVVAIDKLQGR